MFINSFWPPTCFNFKFTEKKIKETPFDNSHSLDDLAKILTQPNSQLDQWIEWKNEIKTCISKHSKELAELDKLFEILTDWAIKKNPQKAMQVLVEIVNLDLLTEVIKAKKGLEDQFESIFELAVENALICPEPPDTSVNGWLFNEWKRCRPIILYMIPNLLNIFLGAFNFLDTHKKFTTLWEKHLLLEIMYKFFIIPFCLIQILQPILVVNAKVYLVAALVIVATGILISSYQRWFKPLPDEIVNCTNLDKQIENGVLDPKVGQKEDIDRLIAALEVHDSVLLRGLSGEGKTALIHHFIQLKHENKLPNKLKELKVFEADCGLMISNLSFGHSELINQTKDQIIGYENRILLFFDDFYQMANNKTAFLAFKKRFLADSPHCKCIMALTSKEWEALKELDSDYSFRRKTYRMKITPSNDEQIRKIIKNYQFHFALDVPVNENAVEAVIQLSGEKDYLPDIGRAAKAEELFKTAIGKSRASLNHHYGLIQLDENELKTNRKLIYTVKKIIAHQQKMYIDFCRLTHIFAKTISQNTKKTKEDAEISLNHLGETDVFDPEIDDVVDDKIVKSFNTKESVSEKDQILYLWYSFYAKKAMESLLESELKKIHSDIPVEVNEALIKRVHHEIKEVEDVLLVND